MKSKALVSTVVVFSNDIGMEFGIKKCGVIITNRGKGSQQMG